MGIHQIVEECRHGGIIWMTGTVNLDSNKQRLADGGGKMGLEFNHHNFKFNRLWYHYYRSIMELWNYNHQ